MTAKALMFMGTGSDVGKSLIVAGIARALANRGLRVMPFKPQNMSNNAAVTADGGEIGRAQALQARAARVATTVHMNPLLLKPESATGAQIILQGKRVGTAAARDFFAERDRYLPAILESFAVVKAESDIVLVEGAGSPAEVNLRKGDLANMGFARASETPCILIGDIHRGGVMASIAGTFDLLEKADRALLRGFLINKFHGDQSLFDDGRMFLAQRTGVPCLGVIGHFEAAHKLPAEDAVVLEKMASSPSKSTAICVLRLPRIANFDDLDPLRLDICSDVRFVMPGQALPGDAALVIIPGSKSTIADLAALRSNGWDIDIFAHLRRGGRVLGLCGGYQMLGRVIHDPGGIEGPPANVPGLGLLDVETTLTANKSLVQVQALHAASQLPISGYEIHLGETLGGDCARPFAMIGNRPDGATSSNGLVEGTYLHGCFASDAFRTAYLGGLGIASKAHAFEQTIEETLDALSEHIAASVDLETLLEIAR